MFVYDHDGETTGRRGGVTNSEFFARVVTEVVRLLSTHTDRGFAYRVDLRLRPEGQSRAARAEHGQHAQLLRHDGPDVGAAGAHQAAARRRRRRRWPASSSRPIEPFVYRKYFSFAEINEVKALKRQMEQRGHLGARSGSRESGIPTDVKTGRGGIRDIEYAVQFLQLLNGGDLPAVRQRNTLLALEALEIAGCLNSAGDVHPRRRLPVSPQDRAPAATALRPADAPPARARPRSCGSWRCGWGMWNARRAVGVSPLLSSYEAETVGSRPPLAQATLAPQKRSPLDESAPPPLDTRDLLVDPLDQFLKDLHDKTALDRTILNHLLHQTFADADAPDAGEPEADLILDPDPDEATVRAVLGRYPFRDPQKAFANLSQLARESVPFLSSRRCRHFLASIAPQLLRAVADTPDPDEALTQLERVSASLGAKAVLWELFSQNPPILKLYVELCAGSPFLSGLLINNPGMIDELLDSLVLNQPRTAEELRPELDRTLPRRQRPRPDPAQLPGQGVPADRRRRPARQGRRPRHHRRALGRGRHALNQVVELVEPEVRAKLGTPTLSGRPCRYAAPGSRQARRARDQLPQRPRSACSSTRPTARPRAASRTRSTSPSSPSASSRWMSQMGPMGRLYAVDMRLRPTGKSGSLVLPLAEFRRYFDESRLPVVGTTVARPGSGRARRSAPSRTDVLAAHARRDARRRWSARLVDEVRGDAAEARSDRRPAKPEARARRDRGRRVRGAAAPAEVRPSTHPRDSVSQRLGCARRPRSDRLLPSADAASLRAGYSFLRLVEARLRIVTDRPLTEVPEGDEDRAKLAQRLGFDSPDRFLARIETRERRDSLSIRSDQHPRAKRVKLWRSCRRFRMCGISHTHFRANPDREGGGARHPVAHAPGSPGRRFRLPRHRLRG